MKTKLTLRAIVATVAMIIGVLLLAACSKKPDVGPSKGTVALTKYKTWNENAFYFSNNQDSLKTPIKISPAPASEHIAITFYSNGRYVWGPNSGTWKLFNNDTMLVLTSKTGNTLSYEVTISDGSFTMLHEKSSTPGAYSYLDTLRDTISPGYDYELVSYTGSNK
jgi:hypothetical protein